MRHPPNKAVEQDRPKAALLDSLRGFAAPAASHGKRSAAIPMAIHAPILRLEDVLQAKQDLMRVHVFSLCRPTRRSRGTGG